MPCQKRDFSLGSWGTITAMLHLVLVEAALWYDKSKPTLPLDWGLARLLGV